MKSKAIFMALLALAFGAQAVSVDVEKAKLAARGWARRGGTFGIAFGDGVLSANEHTTSNGVRFFSAKMKGGGTVFLSGDTELSPVIAFTADATDCSTIDPASPLWALLNRDLSVRGHRLQLKRAAGASSAVTQSREAKLWGELVAEGDPLVFKPAFAPAIASQGAIGDLRVAPLVKSKWSQSLSNGKACWNYYTPNGADPSKFVPGSPKNAVCGCVATAMSQIMRRHCYPTQEISPVTHTCTYNGANVELTTQAGVYDWESMTLVPNGSKLEDANYQAIGKLTSDAGITVFMQYTDGESGAFDFDITYALMKHWGYKNSVFLDLRYIDEYEGAPERDEVLQKAFFANFDAGYPVGMGVPGHSIVGDGYGYNNGHDYVHLNMGWAGQCDYWYNIPDETAAHPAFTAIEDANYNIFPDKDRTHGIISGRLLNDPVNDSQGIAIKGATVRLYKSGTHDTPAAEVLSSETGVWGAAVPAGKYDVEAVSANGEWKASCTGITVKAPNSQLMNWNYLGRMTPSVIVGEGEQPVDDVGNSWGNDLQMEEVEFPGSVRNADTGVEYGALDSAIAEAGDGHTLEILAKTLLHRPQAIDKSLTIRTASGVLPGDAPVNCRAIAAHGFTNVLNGATLALENVVFNGTEGCFVHVSDGAALSVCGTVGLSDGSFVRTEGTQGIRLDGELTNFLTVDCLVSKDAGQQFGVCSDEAFAASAARFLNPYDEDLGGVVSGSRLVWGGVPVDPSLAIAYFTGDAGVNKQYYRKLNTLFGEQAGKDGDVVILKDCELKAPVSVTSAMRLVCTNEAGAATVTYAKDGDALIAVEPEGKFSVSNVVLTDAASRGALLVRGGELTLESGTVIENCTNWYHEVGVDDLYAGAGGVTVTFDDNFKPGHATVSSGVVIRGCEAVYGGGGGIFVDGDYWFGGCSLDLRGGTVTNCTSALAGGGLCALTGAAVELSGDVRVSRNASDGYACDNVSVDSGDILALTGELTAGEPIGLRCSSALISESYPPSDDQFGLIAADFGTGAAVTNSARLFRSDDLPGVWHGEVGTDEGGNAILVWSNATLPEDETDPEPESVVRVIYAADDGTGKTNTFRTLDRALNQLNANAFDGVVTVELMADRCDELVMSNGVQLATSVILKTSDNDSGKIVKIVRPADRGPTVFVNFGADLTLTNVWLSGGNAVALSVCGGALTMEAGSTVSDVTGKAARDDCGVSVGEGGTFTMRAGAEIARCENSYASADGSQRAPAGGVVVEGENSVFRLEGGSIYDCAGVLGGGVFVGNDAKMFVAGESTIVGNRLLSGSKVTTTNANLSVANESGNESASEKAGNLILTGEFTGDIGVLEPRLYRTEEVVNVGTNVFGKVSKDVDDLAGLLPCAAKFYRDAAPSVTGLIVTNADPMADALLVWSSAVKDGVYTDEEGKRYLVVETPEPPPPPPPPTEIEPPTAVTGLIYNGNEQTGVVEADGYTVTGNTATDAGDYTATVTLKDGYVWTGGSSDPLQIGWSIAKATYDMSGVTFTGASFEADGNPKSISVQGQLPDGVSVSYEGNGQTEPGSYTVTAKFTGDAVNYEPIANMTATLTITKKEDPEPDPQWDVITNYPTPIAFKSIDRVGDTEWKLVITNRVEYCNYRLLWTKDLTKGFTETGKWEHAVGPAAEPVWTTNVLTTGGAWFWRAEGTEGTNMVPREVGN